MLPGLARWCYRHRRLVVVGWTVLLIGVNVLAHTAGGDLVKSLSLPGTESQRTFDIMKTDFAQPGDTGYLVFKSTAPGGAQSREAFDVIERQVAPELRKQKHVASVL